MIRESLNAPTFCDPIGISFKNNLVYGDADITYLYFVPRPSDCLWSSNDNLFYHASGSMEMRWYGGTSDEMSSGTPQEALDGLIAATGQDKVKKSFEPMTPGFRQLIQKRHLTHMLPID